MLKISYIPAESIHADQSFISTGSRVLEEKKGQWNNNKQYKKAEGLLAQILS
jgi:hypothetical protein